MVANIPYHITTPIIFKLLEYRDRLGSMTLTVQKELAERVTAGPGSKTYGVLSLAVQYHTEPSMEFIIPAKAFRPVPKVDSACLHMRVLKEPRVRVKDERVLFHLIRTAFSQRRKTLKNSLAKLVPDLPELLSSAGVDATLRPERLDMEEFARLADLIYSTGFRVQA